MDYPLQLTSQLQPLLKSLRKSRNMTQAQLARHLGVVQSRVADIEREPGSVSVEQFMNILATLGAQLVVRETEPLTLPSASGRFQDTQTPAHPAGPDDKLPQASAPPSRQERPSSAAPHPDDAPGAPPRGQW
ncbi:helix-turn-helix domain-containing protein [Ideonella sp. DXS22W]|uniref:Helix-turn-helix domain-containing protein n=1 Tax=Pseudaquabacterium inlustre TaxID=2984192 RepID=A0ABU9CD41_9BURK